MLQMIWPSIISSRSTCQRKRTVILGKSILETRLKKLTLTWIFRWFVSPQPKWTSPSENSIVPKRNRFLRPWIVPISGRSFFLLLRCFTSFDFRHRFGKSDYTFGNENNLTLTTFYVYVYDFQPPLLIQISFSQYPKLNLQQFFITFSS